MDFLSTVFKLLGLFDMYRQQNPRFIGATNHPHNEANSERRLDRIYHNRFLIDEYLYGILRENFNT